jgi:meiotically up-regulated gene 157 (Mug157) protein
MKYPILIALLLCCLLCDELNDTITCINSYVATYKGKMSSQLFDILVKAFPNTMSTTVQHYNISTPGQESTYIITGDI